MSYWERKLWRTGKGKQRTSKRRITINYCSRDGLIWYVGEVDPIRGTDTVSKKLEAYVYSNCDTVTPELFFYLQDYCFLLSKKKLYGF
ncbi:MAG TPA: hypothetical protein VE619_00205 [Nitrososphaeraceae archaeon]|nr:hypothetical protein [Nitrososphaeraceae archaeon]